MTKRRIIDSLSSKWMVAALSFFLLLPLAIGAGLIVKSSGLLKDHSIISLVTSSEWSPMDGQFGFWPFILSSLWVTITAILISMPLCLLAAIYLSQFAPKWMLRFMHPVIDILAGIPSVVYGVLAVLVIIPLVRDTIATLFHADSFGYCILSGVFVLAVMSIPYIFKLLLEVFRQIPVERGEASLALGATKWETIKKVFIRKGGTGILSD